MFKRFGLLILVLLVLGAAGCGDIIEQNYIVLKFKLLGERAADLSNVDISQTELFTARRLPLVHPQEMYIIFPRGNQSYRFTALVSVESSTNEAFTINAVDGNLTFDVVVQLHINTTYPDLKERLVRFCRDYSFSKYAGNPNALGMFVSENLKPQLTKAFSAYLNARKVLELTRSKSEVNQFVKDAMNTRYDQYALEFTLVGIGSAFTFDPGQQKRMNDIVTQEVENRILQIDNKQIKPLEKEIARIQNTGTKEAAGIRNEAEERAAKILAGAWKERRKMIIDVIGEEGYVKYERVKTFATALEESDSSATMMPSDMSMSLEYSSQTSQKEASQ